jgi:hypothetical protein
MTRLIVFAAIALSAASAHAAPWADSVVEYEPGTIRDDYRISTAALGKTASTTGVVVTPFNAPFSPDELTGVGPGGHLTLHLGQTAATGAGYTLGVHAGVNLINVGGTTGRASKPAGTFSVRRSDVSVSYDNVTWMKLQDDVVFNIPTNWYSHGVTAPASQTTPGTSEADFTKPFVGTLSSFSDLTYAEMLPLLDGSAGGMWFDLSGVALPGVNYVKFSVDDQDVQMYVDMVVAIPEPASLSLLIVGGGIALGLSRRRISGTLS